MKLSALVILVACLLVIPATAGPTPPALPGPAEQNLMTRAYDLIRRDRNDQAIAVMEQFLAENHKPSHLFFYTLGNCCLRADQPEKGVAYLRRSLKAAPGYAPAWISLGHGCYALGQYDQSGDSFLKGYETADRKEPRHLYHSAASYYQAENHQQALALFSQLVDRHPDDMEPDWKGIPARIYLEQKEFDKALPLLEELAETTSGERRQAWRQLLLQQYLQLGMTSEALDLTRSLTRLEPLEPLWWQLLAHVRTSLREYERSVAAMTIKDFLSPLSTGEKQALADLNLAAGIPDQSLKIYQSLFKSDPSLKTVKKIVTSCLLLHRPDEAMKWAAIGLDIEPDPDLLLITGNLAYQDEAYPRALEAYEALAATGHDSGRAWLMLGYAALQTGDDHRAAEAFRRALRFDAQKQAARSVLSYLEQKNRGVNN